MMQTLSDEYYYLGCINSSGDSDTIKNMRYLQKHGYNVTAFDLNPGCYSHPYRVFVEGREDEAWETLCEHIEHNPLGKIGRFVLSEISEQEAADECIEFSVKLGDKFLAPVEDWIVAFDRIKNIEQIKKESAK
jgi:hypothetical protein